MARNEKLAREKTDEKSLLDRRGYLKLAGAAAASVATFGSSATAESSSDVILRETFEDTNYTEYFNAKQPDDNQFHELTTNTVKNGDNALKVRFPEGRHDGMGARLDPVDAGLIDSPTREMYARYWVYFPEDFVGDPQGKKLPGPVNYMEDLSTTDGNGDGHGGDPAEGYGWSARTGFNDTTANEIEIGGLPYRMDYDGGYPADTMGYRNVSKGEWHRIDQHVVLNTVSGGSANADGVYEMWIDGNKNIDRSDIRWTNHPEKGIDYEFTIWYGGTNTSPKDQAVYLDGWTLATSPIDSTTSSSDTTSTPDDTQSNEQGTTLELVTSSDMSTTNYEFVVEGSVSKHTSAGDNAAEGNDAITDNGDGTATVTGATGNGSGDAYYVDGTIVSMNLGSGDWTLRYDGSQVSQEDIVFPNKLVIDGSDHPNAASTYQFSVSGSVTKSAALGSINSHDTASNGEISGRVIGGKDGYRFSGEVTGFNLDGPANVRVEDGR